MIEVLKPTRLPRARETGALVADILQTLKSRSTVGTNLLDIDGWAETMIVECRSGVLLRRLRAVLRPRAVRPLHLHLRQRRRAARPAARLRAGRRRPAVARPRRLPGRGRRRLGHQLRRRRLEAAGERRDDRARPSARWQRGSPRPGPGARVGDLSHAIGSVLTRRAIPVNTQFGGHGVGSTMHQDPHIAEHRPARPRIPAATGSAAGPGAVGDGRHRRRSSPTPTAGPCAARRAAGPRTASTRSPITDDGAEILTLAT